MKLYQQSKTAQTTTKEKSKLKANFNIFTDLGIETRTSGTAVLCVTSWLTSQLYTSIVVKLFNCFLT